MKKFALTVTLLALWAIKAVHAAEFFCSSGDVTCLIASINKANLSRGTHTIFLESGLYRLTIVDNNTDGTNGLPSIRTELTIRNDDGSAVIERDLAAPLFRIFHVAAQGNLRLYQLSITGGRIVGDCGGGGGGAILNRGLLTVERVAMYQNQIVSRNCSGGAILNRGTTTVMDSALAENRADNEDIPAGGAISNDGSLTVTRSLIGRNVGAGIGGIASRGGTVFIGDSAIVENDGTLDAGGLGIFFPGQGGTGSMTIVNTTIARNRSLAGGVVVSGGAISVSGGLLTVLNSTIAENVSVLRSDLFGSGSGGINNFDVFGGTVNIQNTILARNRIVESPLSLEDGFPSDCFGRITSQGNNIIGDTRDCDIELRETDFVGDPGLGDFAGTYYPLLPDSPAIDSGNPAACPAKDQLGLPRLGRCDIGSVEFQGGRMVVSVDVRPRSDANRINPNSTNSINVAILSGNGFDATTVDPSSVRFGATGTEAAPIHVGRRDVDGDGDRDMVVRFEIQDTGIKCGDTSAILTGQTSGGLSIVGSSPITTVQCNQQPQTFVSR